MRRPLLPFMLGACARVPGEAVTADPTLAWLGAHATPIVTVEAGSGFDDLEPLREIIGEARVVALGDGTHGTREFYQAKHRIVEFLVREMNFRTLAIETNLPDAAAIDDYVQGGVGGGDARALLYGLGDWQWKTEEMRATVDWMRNWNADTVGGVPLRFAGFDMREGHRAVINVRTFLAVHDPGWVDPALDALHRYDPLRQQGRAGWGCVGAHLPAQAFRGRTLRLTGTIKTRNLSGWAGFWVLADGAHASTVGGREMGTTGWAEQSVVLKVPVDANEVRVGASVLGRGDVWVDDFSVEVDGAAWPTFGGGFEEAFSPEMDKTCPFEVDENPKFVVALDASTAATGTWSLALRNPGVDLPDLSTLVRWAERLVGHMEAERARYRSEASVEAAEWAIRNARVMQQWLQRGNAADRFAWRDQAMAENVLWIQAQDPESRVIVWAHNGHVQYQERYMGSWLHDALGDDYVSVAFAASHGTYTALGRDGITLGAHQLPRPPVLSVEAHLERSGRSMLLVDLRAANPQDPVPRWLTHVRPFGGTVRGLQATRGFRGRAVAEDYDALFWIRDTTATKLLPVPGDSE